VNDGPVERLDLMAFKDADFVMLATDNQNAEIEVGQRCLWLKIPLIQASVHGETFLAQVRFFGKNKQAPCPVCGYSRAEWNDLNRQTQFSCEVGGPRALDAKISGPPTMSVSFLCSLAADLALAQLLRHTLALGKPIDNTMLEFCMYTHKTAINVLGRNFSCPCDHAHYVQACTLGKISELSLAEIAGIAGYDRQSGLAGVSFKLGNMQYCEQGFCSCSQNQPLRRFFYPGKGMGRCSNCGGEIHPHPFFTFKRVPTALLSDQWDLQLAVMGGKTEKWVMLRGPEQSLILISN
jgi:hypothetical protein